MYFLQVFAHLSSSIAQAHVFGQKHTNPTEFLDMRKQNRYTDPFTATAGRRLNAREGRRKLALLGYDRATCTMKQGIHDIETMRRCTRIKFLATRRHALLIGDDDAPAVIGVIVLNLDKAACLEKWQSIARVPHHFATVGIKLRKRLFHGIVRSDFSLVRDSDGIVILLSRSKLVLEHWNRRSLLELEKAALQHKLGGNSFYPHQIQNHVIAEMKSAVQSISLALDHDLGSAGFELFIKHHNDDTTVIQTATTSTTTHLNKLTR